jgi:hypothetical protein
MWTPELIVQIRSNCLITYFENHYHHELTEEQKLKIQKALEAARKQQYSGELTQGARKRLTKCIDLLVQCIKPKRIFNEVTQKTQLHKLSFITLTISRTQPVTPRQAYDQVFKHFLQWLRRTMKVTTYIWKIELQQRGQPHYHITTPSFIHYQKIRDKWNNLQRQANYLTEYEATHGHSDPNSTDIHEVNHVNDLSGYLKKEFAKSVQNITPEAIWNTLSENEKNYHRAITYTEDEAISNSMKENSSKIWDASYNLKGSEYYKTQYNLDMLTRLSKLKQESRAVEKEMEQCSVIEMGSSGLEQFLTLEQLLEYDIHKLAIKEKITNSSPQTSNNGDSNNTSNTVSRSKKVKSLTETLLDTTQQQ